MLGHTLARRGTLVCSWKSSYILATAYCKKHFINIRKCVIDDDDDDDYIWIIFFTTCGIQRVS